ncbi:outer membrane protein assembly factor BamE [Sulfitobacter sp. S190]|uniref:outer membrane protein assembly factor BamE n=1 Tax=Sulfitobacter sp. S190 TaxID=2867022 RepID=UPI0021A4DC39|nr:outer membrane protein assembly factor BamE [Sulfitobacter sp. S190]UWR23811.1 outer membrane protein assembly factor BamE [Sulfitobacter sp. S190]
MQKYRNARTLRHVIVATAAAVALSACAPTIKNHGYIPPSEDLDLITVGVDTRASVEETVGAPSTAGVVNNSGFYYVRSQRSTLGFLPTRETEREVLAISFDTDGVVTNIERFGLERGQVVPISRRVTDAGVENKTFLRQLLGNLSRFSPAGLGGGGT